MVKTKKETAWEYKVDISSVIAKSFCVCENVEYHIVFIGKKGLCHSIAEVSKYSIMSKYRCLTSVTHAKCGICSTLCWKIGNISGSTELFAL